jgi:3-oxoacyl-[acyl-carrier protein] reductase
MTDAKDRVAVITGATKGLGRALALNFARHGYNVVGLYKADHSAAKELKLQFSSEGLTGRCIQHDVTDEDVTALQQQLDSFDSPHLTLINNACASFTPQPMHLLKWDDFESSFTVAVKGAWNCTQLVLRGMLKARYGNIVNVLTTAVNDLPPKGFAAYVTSKYALQGLTRAIASEYSTRGVRVFSVSPGFMETSLTSAWDQRLRDSIRQSSPNVQDPATVAEQVRQLVENPETAGRGEDYSLG